MKRFVFIFDEVSEKVKPRKWMQKQNRLLINQMHEFAKEQHKKVVKELI